MSRAVRGSGFRGVCEYALTRSGKKEKGVIVGGNMEGTSPRELSAEFGKVRNLRVDIAKPVSHNCLRLPAGERLSAEKWREVADDFMNQMGFTHQNQRVYVLHDDVDGQHIHLIANRIGEDGKVWLGKNENLIATKIINSLEPKYKLKVTVEKAGKEAKEPKKQESERAKRKNEEPPRIKIQKTIDKIFAEVKPLDIADFNRQLKKADIWIKINRASTGKINGFSFDFKGTKFKGSDLGKAYSLAGLEKKGLIIPKTYKQEQEQYAKLHKIYESNTQRYEEGRARVNISDTPDLRSLPLGYVVHPSQRRAEMLLHANKDNSMGRNGYGRDYGMRRTDSGIGGARNNELKIIKNNTKKDSQMNTQNYIFNDAEISEFERKRLAAIQLAGWYHFVANDKTVYKKDGQQIEDRGSKIIVDGGDYEKLAVAAVELALKKGWRLQDIKAGGEKEFVEEVNKEIAKRQNQNATQNATQNVIENDTKKDTQNDDDNDGVKHNEKSWDEVVEQIIADNYDGKSIEEALEEVEAIGREQNRDRGLDV